MVCYVCTHPLFFSLSRFSTTHSARSPVLALSKAKCKIAYRELTIGETIGDGSYGSVPKGKYKCKVVAVKKLKVGNEYSQAQFIEYSQAQFIE